MHAVAHSVPPSSGAGGGTRRQTCLSVSEFLTSRHWRAAQGSPQGRHCWVSFSPYFFWTNKRSMPCGEQRQSDGRLSDDNSKQVFVYRKNLFYFPAFSNNQVCLGYSADKNDSRSLIFSRSLRKPLCQVILEHCSGYPHLENHIVKPSGLLLTAAPRGYI